MWRDFRDGLREQFWATASCTAPLAFVLVFGVIIGVGGIGPLAGLPTLGSPVFG